MKESLKMKKDIKPNPLTESEKKKLIHLKAENAIIKKEIALREKMGCITQGEKAAIVKELREN